MSRPATPSGKPSSTRSHREDVLQFLDDLDKDTPAKAGSQTAAGPSKTAAVTPADGSDDPQSVLDFLDEIVATREKRSTTPAGGSSVAKKGSSTATGGASGVSRSASRATLGEDSASLGSRQSRDKDVPPRKSGESVRSTYAAGTAASSSVASQAADKLQEAAPLRDDAAQQQSSGWGWGSVWSQASNVLQQARTVAEEQAKNLPKNIPSSISSLQNQLPVSPSSASSQAQAGMNAASAQAQKWRSGMLNILSTHVDVDKLRRDITETGMKAMQDIMNAVAPPIAEHEVIQVNLSHDMLGYEGVETLVYRALAKVMEQVDGGDLVVNKGQVEDSPSGKQPAQPADPNTTEEDEERNLNTVEGFIEAYKLAEANLDALLKRHYQRPSSASADASKSPSHGRKDSNLTVPVTICPVYMRIQPVIASMPFETLPSTIQPEESSSSAQPKTSEESHLYFILILRDPTNELVHKTLSQSMPSKWLDIPFEENEWVEDIMVDVIRRSVEIIGEEYIKGRMHGRLLKNAKAETIFEGDAEEEALKSNAEPAT